MLTIICGDNVAASRKKYNDLRQQYSSKGFDITELNASNIKDLITKIEGSHSLFGSDRVFFIENALHRKEYRDLVTKASKIADTDIVAWDEKVDDRTVKFGFKTAKVHVEKLPHNIWKLLDAVYPGNSEFCLEMLQSVTESVDEHMVLFMLQKRAKELLMIREGLTGSKKLASWQIGKLSSQAKKWDIKKLQNFYQKLFNIERGIKTGNMPYSAKKSLDILFCFYLQ